MTHALLQRPRAPAKPLSEVQLRAYAAAGVEWAALARERGIDRSTLMGALQVLGIWNDEPQRVRRAILFALRDRDRPHTVEELRDASKGSPKRVKNAIQMLREAGLIKSTVRRVQADEPRKPWAQYIITDAGRKAIEGLQPSCND